MLDIGRKERIIALVSSNLRDLCIAEMGNRINFDMQVGNVESEMVESAVESCVVPQ